MILPIYTPTNKIKGILSYTLSTLGNARFFHFQQLLGCEMIQNYCLDLQSSHYDTEYFFIDHVFVCLLVCLLFVKCLLMSFPHFLSGAIFLLMYSSSYILGVNHLLIGQIVNVFSLIFSLKVPLVVRGSPFNISSKTSMLSLILEIQSNAIC